MQTPTPGFKLQIGPSLTLTHIVDDAKFVSSCFNWPSKANPLLSLLFANKGRTANTFDIVNPGETGQPAL